MKKNQKTEKKYNSDKELLKSDDNDINKAESLKYIHKYTFIIETMYK